jgi:hypothetical protein
MRPGAWALQRGRSTRERPSLWTNSVHTGTGGHPNAYIRVLNNGPLVIYDANDAVIWSSN